MSWSRQVWHVFMKDVREQKWVLALYVALLCFGTMQGVRFWPIDGDSEPFLPLLGSAVMRAVAAYLAASLILGDSPNSPRAYWATLPFARSAVFGAKVLGFVGLLLTAVAAFIPPLVQLEVSATQLWLQLLNFSVAFSALLVATAVFASVVSRLRYVLLVPLAAIALMIGGLVVVAKRGFVLQYDLSSAVVLVVIAGALGALAFVYLTRRVNVTQRSLTLVPCALLLIAPFAVSGFGPVAPVIEPARITGIAPSISLVVGDAAYRMGSQIPALQLQTSGRFQLDGATPATRVELRTRYATTVDALGNDRDAVGFDISRRLVEPALPIDPDVRWIGADIAGSTGTFRQSVSAVSLSREEDSIHTAAISRIRTEGRFEFRTPRLLGSVAASRDTAFAHDGVHLRIKRGTLAGAPVFEVQTMAVLNAPDGVERVSGALDHLSFALVHDEHREAVKLSFQRSSSSVGGSLLAPLGISRGSSMLVAEPSLFYAPVRPDSISAVRALVTPEWLRGARLVIYEWVLTGTSPVNISSAIGRTSAGD